MPKQSTPERIVEISFLLVEVGAVAPVEGEGTLCHMKHVAL
jgi:hypothetical protein